MNSGLAPSIAALLNRWRSRFSRSKDSSPEHIHARGARGEKLAAKFLRKQGYKVLYRNFKPKHGGGGQIDIVCRDHETLVFVEVKTRNTDYFGRPVDAVHSDQQRRISRGALAWLRMLDNPEIVFRFDVVEVMMLADEKPELALVRDAFKLSKPYRY
jgi:putative endonuclease